MDRETSVHGQWLGRFPDCMNDTVSARALEASLYSLSDLAAPLIWLVGLARFRGLGAGSPG